MNASKSSREVKISKVEYCNALKKIDLFLNLICGNESEFIVHLFVFEVRLIMEIET